MYVWRDNPSRMRAEMSHLRVHRAVAVEIEGAHARFSFSKTPFTATLPLGRGVGVDTAGAWCQCPLLRLRRGHAPMVGIRPARSVIWWALHLRTRTTACPMLVYTFSRYKQAHARTHTHSCTRTLTLTRAHARARAHTHTHRPGCSRSSGSRTTRQRCPYSS